MSKVICRLWPESIAAQLLLVMLTSLGMIILFAFAAFQILRPSFPGEQVTARVLKTTVVLTRLNQVRNKDREAILKRYLLDEPSLNIRILASDEILLSDADKKNDAPVYGFPFWIPRQGGIGDGMKLVGGAMIHPAPEGPDVPVFVFQLRDGVRVAAMMDAGPGRPILGDPLFMLFVFLVVTSLLLLVWVTRMLISPLSSLSSAVSTFGKTSMRTVPIAEDGPTEVKKVARAFNRMQGRIQELLERRTRMLAAVSHDLRTPLTRLRLRTELMPDGEMKQRNLADLDIMETQLSGALTYLSEGRTGEPNIKIDVASFLQGIRDQYEDVGTELAIECEGGLAVVGRFSELTRAMTNLIDNARRYDDRICLISSGVEDKVIIEVEDHGPGIPLQERERMLMPFERGDNARMLGTDSSFGFGLGLATACAIVEAHHGQLTLNDTEGGGLTVRIELLKA